jgi:hypothetical protein
MNNRRISEQSVGKVKVEKCNEPAVETANARVEQVGAFRVDALAANQAGVAEKYQGVDANAQLGFVPARAGHIVGIGWSLSTAVTAGAASLQATVGGAASGDIADLTTAASGTKHLSVPIAFNEGDKLGVKHTTNGGFTPTPNVVSWLLIRWTSLEGAVADALA